MRLMNEEDKKVVIETLRQFIRDMEEVKSREQKLKPSERIEELAEKLGRQGIDPGFYGYRPQLSDWVSAIIAYLDEVAIQNQPEK